MAAADELREFLDNLKDDALKEFCRKVDYTEPPLVITPTTSRTKRVLLDSNLRHHLPGFNFATYRREIVRRILSAETDDPGFFNRVCREAEIETDDARALGYQASAARSAEQSAQAAQGANRIARWALAISIFALIVSTLVVIFKK